MKFDDFFLEIHSRLSNRFRISIFSPPDHDDSITSHFSDEVSSEQMHFGTTFLIRWDWGRRV